VDVTIFLLSLVAFALVLGTAEVLHRRVGVSSEDTRRVAHIGSAVIAAALPFVMGWTAIALLGLTLTGVMVLSKRRHLLRGVHDVARRTWGEVFFPAGLTVLAAARPPRALYVYGALVMGVSDGLAGLVGQHLGHHPYSVGATTKSYEGSAAFFASSLVLGLAVLALSGWDPWHLLIATGVAALLTLLEAVLPFGLDNLVLPGAAAVTLWALEARVSWRVP
jgi:phytol kinase